jgi:hypothetical protein
MSQRRIHVLRAVLLLAMALLPCGCQRGLFPQDAPRTQFDSYNRMRGRYAPLEEPDVFGNPQPALRARLGRDY